jgi:hypothetical protein
MTILSRYFASIYETRFIDTFTPMDRILSQGESCPYIIQYNRKVGQPEFWYLLLVRNECSGFELVTGYVGMTVQNLCKSKHRSRDLTPPQQWLYNHSPVNVSFLQVQCVFNRHFLQSESYLKSQMILEWLPEASSSRHVNSILFSSPFSWNIQCEWSKKCWSPYSVKWRLCGKHSTFFI